MTEAPRTTNAPTIDIEAVTAFLNRREHGVASDIRRLRQGGWSSAWAYRVGARHEVIRFSHLADDFEQDKRAASWSSDRVPIPPFRDLCEAIGGWCAVTDYRKGDPLNDLDAARLCAVFPSFFAMLDGIRAIDPGGCGFGGIDRTGNGSYASWTGFLTAIGEDEPGNRLGGWRNALANSPVGILRFDAAVSRLGELSTHLPGIRHVIHNDLLNANVLVDGERISAVLDWGCAMIGDFVYDLAVFAFYWPWYPQWSDIDFVDAYKRHASDLQLELPEFETRLRCYQMHLGLGDVRYCAHLRDWTAAERAMCRIEAIAGWE